MIDDDTGSIYLDNPCLQTKTYPIAGPSAVPAVKPDITGAMVLARLSGVLMSGEEMIRPPLSAIEILAHASYHLVLNTYQ